MNKSFITLLCAVFMSISVYAQSVPADQVPSPAKKTIMTKYASAKEIEWSKNADVYTAEFMLKGDWHVVQLSKTGTWLKSEVSLDAENLPASVVSSVEKLFESYEITSATRVETPTKKHLELSVDTEDDSYLLTLSLDGKLLTKKLAEYEDMEEDEEDDM